MAAWAPDRCLRPRLIERTPDPNRRELFLAANDLGNAKVGWEERGGESVEQTRARESEDKNSLRSDEVLFILNDRCPSPRREKPSVPYLGGISFTSH